MIGHLPQIQKCFVDRIHFKLRDEFVEAQHHTVGKVAVKRVIRRKYSDLMLFNQRPDLKNRYTHGNAQRLGFVGT